MAEKSVTSPIQVWILTGFLGSGKTTLLNHWLNDPFFKHSSLALIINEFGKLGVDAKQLTPGQYTTFEINKGSVFCICTQTDLLKAFDTIQQIKPEHVIIEATGIAQPSDLQALLNASQWKDQFQIRHITCVIDAEHFIKTAAFSTACVSQARSADTLVINKKDLLSKTDLERLIQVVQGLQPQASLFKTEHGQLPIQALQQSHPIPQAQAFVTRAPEEIVAVSLHTEHPIRKQDFTQTLDSLGSHILRLKGKSPVRTGGCVCGCGF